MDRQARVDKARRQLEAQNAPDPMESAPHCANESCGAAGIKATHIVKFEDNSIEPACKNCAKTARRANLNVRPWSPRRQATMETHARLSAGAPTGEQGNAHTCEAPGCKAQASSIVHFNPSNPSLDWMHPLCDEHTTQVMLSDETAAHPNRIRVHELFKSMKVRGKDGEYSLQRTHNTATEKMYSDWATRMSITQSRPQSGEMDRDTHEQRVALSHSMGAVLSGRQGFVPRALAKPLEAIGVSQEAAQDISAESARERIPFKGNKLLHIAALSDRAGRRSTVTKTESDEPDAEPTIKTASGESIEASSVAGTEAGNAYSNRRTITDETRSDIENPPYYVTAESAAKELTKGGGTGVSAGGRLQELALAQEGPLFLGLPGHNVSDLSTQHPLLASIHRTRHIRALGERTNAGRSYGTTNRDVNISDADLAAPALEAEIQMHLSEVEPQHVTDRGREDSAPFIRTRTPAEDKDTPASDKPMPRQPGIPVSWKFIHSPIRSEKVEQVRQAKFQDLPDTETGEINRSSVFKDAVDKDRPQIKDVM